MLWCVTITLSGNRKIGGVVVAEVNAVINEFVQSVKVLLGCHVQNIILYGSYARNEERENSDIDILLLVDLPANEIKRIQNDIYDLAFELELASGKDISPVIINSVQFNYWKDTLPFYRNAEKEEQLLYDTEGV